MIASRETITSDAVAAHYDELDEFYREVWGEHVHHGLWRQGAESRLEAVRALVQHVAAAARIVQGMQVCDIGSGYGATARMLAAEIGAEVTAITISPVQHAFARERDPNGANPRYVLGDWLENDFPDASFAAALAIESSEHMLDKAAFFKQAARVLQPGGRLIVCAWLSRDTPNSLQQRWLLEPICREGRMPHIGTARDYECFAREAGFSCENFEDVTRQVASTWRRIVGRYLGKLIQTSAYVRILLDGSIRNRVFGLTIFRIWIAYSTGAMRYGVFTLRKN